MQTRQLYHGTNGDNILSILASGKLFPSAQHEIFFSSSDWKTVLMYGADQKRKATFAIKVEVTFPDQIVQVNLSTPGNPATLLVQTIQPLAAKVLELYIRKPGEDGFVFDQIRGELLIQNYLQR
jgi:hypothetical protein